MLIKVLIVIALLVIIWSLISALYYLMKKPSGSKQTAKALSIRIGLSLGLFILLFIAFGMGLITPHGILS